MNILNEYKFLLIIIATTIVAIIINFVWLQQDRKFNNFLNEYKQNYTRIKYVWTNDKTIYNVLSTDWISIRGLNDNTLFWKKSFGTVNTIKFIDNFNKTSITWVPPLFENSQFLISFATTRDLFVNWSQDSINLIDLKNYTNSFEKGWSMFEDWYLLLSFYDEKTTYEILNSKIPIWKLILNADTWKKTIISISFKDFTTKKTN